MIMRLRHHPTTGKLAPGYYVLSESKHYNKRIKRYVRKNLGGPYRALAVAKIRLRQVEAFKHMR